MTHTALHNMNHISHAQAYRAQAGKVHQRCDLLPAQEEELPSDARAKVVTHMVMVHQSVRTFSARFQEQLRRHNYVTPKNYLDFIHNYRQALRDNRRTFSDMAARLDGGLQKLIQVPGNFHC